MRTEKPKNAPVVVAPGEVLLDVLLGLEALHELDDLEIGHIDLGVLGGIVVFLGVQDALLEEVLVNLDAVLLGDQHGGSLRRSREGDGELEAMRCARQREALRCCPPLLKALCAPVPAHAPLRPSMSAPPSNGARRPSWRAQAGQRGIVRRDHMDSHGLLLSFFLV